MLVFVGRVAKKYSIYFPLISLVHAQSARTFSHTSNMIPPHHVIHRVKCSICFISLILCRYISLSLTIDLSKASFEKHLAVPQGKSRFSSVLVWPSDLTLQPGSGDSDSKGRVAGGFRAQLQVTRCLSYRQYWKLEYQSLGSDGVTEPLCGQDPSPQSFKSYERLRYSEGISILAGVLNEVVTLFQ
jgi:hypothetical protein